MKTIAPILIFLLAAFVLWLINTGPVVKGLTFIFVVIMLGIGLLLSFAIGEMIVSNNEKAETMNPYLRTIVSILIGAFLIYSFFEIIRISGCKALPY